MGTELDNLVVVLLSCVQYLVKLTDTFVVSIVSRYLNRRVPVCYLAFHRENVVSKTVDIQTNCSDTAKGASDSRSHNS